MFTFVIIGEVLQTFKRCFLSIVLVALFFSRASLSVIILSVCDECGERCFCFVESTLIFDVDSSVS